MVPLLLVVFQRLGYTNLDLVFHVATATSLAVIVPTSMMSTWTHARNGYVRWRQVLAMTPGGLLAVHLASVVAMESAGATMITAFGILLIVASIQMIFLTPKPRETLPAIPSWAVYLLIGILSGGISYFFGIGGGIAAVPLLVLLAGSSIHQAVGTSSCLIVFLALYGTVRNATLGEGFAELPGFSLGFINLLAVACMMPASILCARVGANLAHRARGALLRRLFGALLALEGIRLAVG